MSLRKETIMSNADLVNEVEKLISTYGYERVSETVAYVQRINNLPENTFTLRDAGHNTVTVTSSQFRTLQMHAQAHNLIGAVKYLRSITQLGLKEAKDTVEYSFPNLKAGA